VNVGVLAVVMLSGNVLAAAENWPQFRGATSGIVDDVQLPIEWSSEQHVMWKAAIPGVAWSQPVVWGDKIFVTSAETDEQTKPAPGARGPGISGFAMLFGTNQDPPKETYRWRLLCVNAATGRTVWEQIVREGQPTIKIHANNTYASETPITDGERVIAYFGMTGLYCYDLVGNSQWHKDLGVYPTQFGWGTGSSPVLLGDRVFIQCDNDQSSFLVALDKKSGDELWRVNRDEKSNWSTPYIWKNKVRTELVTAGGNQIRSYDPESGDLLWFMKGSGRTATTPTGNDELLYVDSYDRLTGGTGNLVAIRPGAAGDISLSANEASSQYVAWRVQLRGQRVASPVLYEHCLYVLEQNSGIIRCIKAETGEELFRKRLPEATGFTASPLANDGKIFCFDQSSRSMVIKAAPELDVLATNTLDGEMCWASPAVAGDRLLIRTVDHLYCIGR
jgi:outer membrane protein assembly factor BamB